METSDPGFGVSLGVIPYDRSYWVVPGRLLAGYYPASRDPARERERLERLVDAGVGHVVDLTEAGELRGYIDELEAIAAARGVEIRCERMSIVDLGVPTPEYMSSILDKIDAAMEAGKTVYVHCWGGRGRTGTVVGCWMVRHGMAAGERALHMIRYLRRTDAKAHTEAPETEAQREFVVDWRAGQ